MHVGHLFTKGELREPPPESPEEERPRLGPRHHLPHRAPGFHSSRRVVKVGELHGNLRRDGASTTKWQRAEGGEGEVGFRIRFEAAVGRDTPAVVKAENRCPKILAS